MIQMTRDEEKHLRRRARSLLRLDVPADDVRRFLAGCRLVWVISRLPFSKPWKTFDDVLRYGWTSVCVLNRRSPLMDLLRGELKVGRWK